jgi:hypothetical protein
MTEAKKPAKEAVKAPSKAGSEYTQNRYWTLIAKGCILPLLYTAMSIMLIRNYVLIYPQHYEYNVILMTVGVVLGLATMTGITAFNIIRAKSKPSVPVRLNAKLILFASIPILLTILVIALVFSISDAWQFSIGYFGTTIVPPILVLLVEVSAKGKFFVRETEKPAKKRHLVLVPNPTG